MIDSDGFMYLDDYLIWSDAVYEENNMINLSSIVLSDPTLRIQSKLCISLA